MCCTVYYKDCIPGPSIVYITFYLLKVILSPYSTNNMQTPMFKHQKSSAVNGHVSVPYSRIYLTTVVYTRPLVEMQMSGRRHSSVKLVNGCDDFWIREVSSSDVGPHSVIHLPEWLNLSPSRYGSPRRRKFDFKPVPFYNSILSFEGVERIRNRRSRKMCKFLGSSFNSAISFKQFPVCKIPLGLPSD